MARRQRRGQRGRFGRGRGPGAPHRPDDLGPALKATQPMEEMLQALYVLIEEQGRESVPRSAPELARLPQHVVDELAEAGYITVTDGTIELTEQGWWLGRGVVRRHRLAERLLTDALDFELGTEEEVACELEHIVSPELTRAICTLLGHPTTCPRGKPIPPGPCCAAHERELETAVLPLTEMAPGERGTIAHISTVDRGRLDRLSGLGVFPGDEVELLQKRPSFVIRAGETTIALDPEVAKDIRIRRLDVNDGE
jgi:DtxR family Mn-dependent transcriptional regulator